jgi:predicted nucleic acid-binding protein
MMENEDLILLDSNILIFAADVLSPFHKRCRAFLGLAYQGEVRLCIAPQVLFEFYAVITHPTRPKAHLTPKEALNEIELYMNDPVIEKIFQDPGIIPRVVQLASRYPVSRQGIYDLVIVATMLGNNVHKICTLDDDFPRVKEIEIITPP